VICRLFIEKTKWPLVLSGILLLFLLNMNTGIHGEIISIDTRAALIMNSVIGISPGLDKMLGWLNTRVGDEVVLSCMCILFLMHSFRGSTSTEVVRRLSFWGWVGALCLAAYAIECGLEHFLRRDIPLLALSQLKNVQTMYGLTLRTSGASSYPSGHAIAYIFFALMAWRRYWRMSLLICAIGFVMLSMRLVLGLHWLSDMTLGSLPISILLDSLAWETSLKRIYRLTERAILSVGKMLGERFPLMLAKRRIYAVHTR